MDAKGSSLHEFHKNRKIIIKDVPPVTYKDIREYLGPIQASDIVISKRHKHVIITLTHGERAEQYVGALATRQLLGKAVNVALYPRRMMLCILGLPLQLDEAQFRRFTEQFGPVEICFLVRGATGMTKGYGVVEFAHNRPTTDRVRAVIAGATFPAADGIIRRPMGCDYVPDSVLHYDDLHSRTVMFLDNWGNPGGAMQLATGSGSMQPTAMSRGVMTANGQNHSFVAATYSTVAEAERAWSLMGGVHARGLPVCSFAMPGIDATQAVQSLPSSSAAAAAAVAPRSTSGSRTTPAEAVKRFGALFPGKTELARAFEKFLSKVVESLNGEPLTDQAVETILALVAKPGSENMPVKVSPSGNGQISLRAGATADIPRSHLPAYGGPQLQAQASCAAAAVPVPQLTAMPIGSNENGIMPPVSWQPSARGFHQPAPACPLGELQHSADASDASYPCSFTVPGWDYEALPSSSGPVTRAKRRSGTFGGGAPSAAAAAAPAPAMASPYSRQAVGSDRQPRVHGDGCFVFEASLDEALSYVSSHKKCTLTPRMLRAAARLLPEPEPSPEGHYIGQHSQGIGGHYAESYWVRKRQQLHEASSTASSPRLHSGLAQLHFR